jgi:hypothetical protein
MDTLNAVDFFRICGASCSHSPLGPPVNLCIRGTVALVLAVHTDLSFCLSTSVSLSPDVNVTSPSECKYSSCVIYSSSSHHLLAIL